jgi:hypothetical protein
MYLNNANQIRSIEWSKSYLWDVKFESGDSKDLSPFDRWLPAINMTDNMAELETRSFQGTMTSFLIPLSGKVKTFSLTFIDDIELTLFHWFKDWINIGILNNGQGLSPINSIKKKIEIVQLNNELEPIFYAKYNVFPYGTISYKGNSDSDNFKFSVNFVKLSIIDEQRSKNTLFDYKSIAKQVLNKIAGGIRYSNL